MPRQQSSALAREKSSPQDVIDLRNPASPCSHPENIAEAAARFESGTRYAELYDLAPVGYLTIGAAGCIDEINRTGADILGWTARQLVGQPLAKWVLAEDVPLLDAHLCAVAARQQPASAQLRLKNRFGRLRDVRLESVVARGPAPGVNRCLTIMLDSAEHRRSERRARIEQAKLMQAARVNMMGELASSLAHELNQPLGVVLLNSNACIEMIRSAGAGVDLAKLEATLTRVCESACYAGEIIRHLRRFLRLGEGERKAVDVNALIVEAIRLVDPDAHDHEVTIRLELAPSLPPAHADAVQIEQVLLNLVRNSIDALSGSTSLLRQITIRTGLAPANQILITASEYPARPAWKKGASKAGTRARTRGSTPSRERCRATPAGSIVSASEAIAGPGGVALLS